MSRRRYRLGPSVSSLAVRRHSEVFDRRHERSQLLTTKYFLPPARSLDIMPGLYQR